VFPNDGKKAACLARGAALRMSELQLASPDDGLDTGGTRRRYAGTASRLAEERTCPWTRERGTLRTGERRTMNPTTKPVKEPRRRAAAPRSPDLGDLMD